MEHWAEFSNRLLIWHDDTILDLTSQGLYARCATHLTDLSVYQDLSEFPRFHLFFATACSPDLITDAEHQGWRHPG